MLYEVKQGGERTGTFELLDIQKREVLPDVLPRGYLRGFAFAPDSLAFYYVHEARSSRGDSFVMRPTSTCLALVFHRTKKSLSPAKARICGSTSSRALNTLASW